MSVPATRRGRAYRTAKLLARILLVVLGGYAAASSVVAGSAVALTWLGMARSEAVVTASMAGFVVYLALLIWGFAERRIARLFIGLAVLSGLGLACANMLASGR